MKLGIHLTLLIGPVVPMPAPAFLLEAMDDVEVTHDDEGRSGFQIKFRVGRSGVADIVDYLPLTLPLLRPFNRVVIVVTVDVMPKVLFDGFITHQELAPGASSITVTGEDVSVMMDLQEKSVEYPAMPEPLIAAMLIAQYAIPCGLIPKIIPPALPNPPPNPFDYVPVQHETDLAYLKTMARRFGHVFYIIPGPAPGTNTAYWGPRAGPNLPQSALSVNMGPNTNVDSISFKNDAMAPAVTGGMVQDRLTNVPLPVAGVPLQSLMNVPPLAAMPSWVVNQPNVRTTMFRESGLNYAEALTRAMGAADAASDVVTAEGELDATRYGDVLQARGIVGVRGAGFTYDGFYYVKRVKHSIRRGQYRQRFMLTREGIGATSPVVVP